MDDLLSWLYMDAEVARIFSREGHVQGWLATEAALALAQADAGVISQDQAEAIASVCTLANVDLEALRVETLNVGYPILPLVRQLTARLPDGPNGRVHYGATTQDIMDTGLTLQVRDVLDRVNGLVEVLGDALAERVISHRADVMPGRTHAQQAVPTTLGAKFSVYLAEIARHAARLDSLRPRVLGVSLFGAGGTAAALGPKSRIVRHALARQLDLPVRDVPWHVARDGLAEMCLVFAQITATCCKLAREVIDLSRTEIGEVAEQAGHHRGASSTMPQKANPITSEAIVGMSVIVQALAHASFRAMEAGHERAAGEWQIEWYSLPHVSALTASVLDQSADLVRGLRVDIAAMKRNLEADGGSVFAEAYMILLADRLGRETAHDVVYDAVRTARAEHRSLHSVMNSLGHPTVRIEQLLGEVSEVCDSALTEWELALHLRGRAGEGAAEADLPSSPTRRP